MGEANFIRITPAIYVSDVAAAVRFFDGTLGFGVAFQMESYAYVFRETAAFRIFKGESAGPAGRLTAYVDVEDIAALWAELKDALEALPDGHVEGPVDRIYGQREVIVRMPDGGLLAFGQTL